MKEKTYTILLVVLAVLLAVSIFFNGWLMYEHSVNNAPENKYFNPKMICAMANAIEDLAQRETLCKSKPDRCKWENNRCSAI